MEQRIMKLEIRGMEKASPTAPAVATPTQAQVGSSRERNKAYIGRLNANQVVELLKEMDLSCYVDTFTKERISGDVLLELEETDLQQELGVKSKVHRIRLMKIINGDHNAADFLS